jgi:YegS/Rv2252/BmrU family lipid kinase
MKKIVAIVNPISGTHDKKRIVQQLHNNLSSKGVHLEVTYTKCQGDATILARCAVNDDADFVVAVGGDGTINEVARGLIDTPVALGIIPCGSGNGLARHMRIPLDINKAIEVIKEANVVSVDYGKINKIPFFCTCGVGFDAFISLKFAQSKRRGLMTYLDRTLREYLNYKPATYIVKTEKGIHEQKAFLIACANASQYGNDAYIAPQASMTDGLMDVVILEPFTFMEVPLLSYQLFNKRIDRNSRIKSFQCKELSIKLSEPSVLHYDGDPLEIESNIDVKLIHNGLNVIAPIEQHKATQNLVDRTIDFLSNVTSRNDRNGRLF